jgi:hypothetical protein
MGTHGLYGYILDGIYYLMYVHYDGDMLMSVMKRESYLILKDFGSIDKVKEVFGQIKWRTSNWNPTKKEIELLEPWSNLEVDIQTNKSWYCLLYHCQKSLIHTLESGYILLHENNKPSEKLPDYKGFMCWWNLDSNVIEFYTGDELIDKLYPEQLISLKPKNFPIKTFDEIVNSFYNKVLLDKEELVNLNNILDQIKNIKISDESYKQDKMENLEERVKYKIKEIKSGNDYTKLLWKDLGVIHYE